jgi:hypothetical protein
MSLFGPIIDRARLALTGAEAAEAQAHAELEAHRKAPADPGDASAIKAWRTREAELTEALEIAKDVLTHWIGVVAEQEERAEKSALAAEHKKLVAETDGAAAKRVKSIAAKSAELAALLAEHREHVERVDAFNARRGDLPFIVDAETRIRSIPGKVTPAIKETRKVWVGTDGKPCSEYTVDAEGRQVRRQGVHEEMREFVIRGELPAVATMPTRFADALVLVDIAGRSL